MTDGDAAPFSPGRSEPGPDSASVPERHPPGAGRAALDAPRWRRWATPERWAVVLALVPAVAAVAVLG
ncbi:MAG TPA: hypothetical protein VFN45_14030, partial [Myxococcaceae bacterium]|nr:hypothetical protein [Myxococcaceae bacterium]